MQLYVLNPVAQKVEKKGPSAPRLAKLDGKLVGLYWNYKAGGDAALRRVGELLKAKYSGIEIRNYVGSTGASNKRLTKNDVERITQECEAVIGSTAD